MFDSALIVEIVRPLLEACDISPEVTLAAFAERTGTTLYLYTVDINQHPLRPTEIPPCRTRHVALARSPDDVLLSDGVLPVFYDGGCYVDGGLATKFLLKQCIRHVARENRERSLADVEERILAFTCCEYTPEQSVITSTGVPTTRAT